MTPRVARVVGAGPAGLSAALCLARAGWEVEVRERLRAPGPRVCGSYLGAEALRHLESLGLADRARQAGGIPINEIRLHAHTGWVSRRPRPAGMALPRETLERLLREAADQAGAVIRHSVTAVLEPPPPGEIGVWAAGRPRPHEEGPGWYGWNASYKNIDAPPGTLSLHFHPGGYVGVMTFSDGSANVCGLRWKNAGGSWEETQRDSLDRLPSLKRLLSPAERVSEWRGVGPLPYATALRPMPEDLFAAGDAGAVGDPFFGEGIGRALGTGPLLLDALSASDPARAYGRLWKHRYSRRLHLGFFWRQALRIPPLLLPALRAATVFQFPLD